MYVFLWGVISQNYYGIHIFMDSTIRFQDLNITV